jgi:hypothetical protein
MPGFSFKPTMKAVLEFNLPDDQYEYNLANDAWKYKSVLINLNEWLRRKVKYEADTMTEEEYRGYLHCRETLIGLLQEEDVDLD